MTIYIVLESIKALMWIIILIMIVNKKRQIPINLFWTGGMSALLMALAGVQDIINNEHLADKSGWWLVANIFILITYFIFIKNSCLFFSYMKQDIDTFLAKLLKDNKKDENSSN